MILSLLRRPALLLTDLRLQVHTWSLPDSGLAPKKLMTQTEGLPRNLVIQVCGCGDCLSLQLPGEDGKDTTCMSSKQVDELLIVVVEVREEAERLRTIRECEREIGWWCDSL